MIYISLVEHWSSLLSRVKVGPLGFYWSNSKSDHLYAKYNSTCALMEAFPSSPLGLIS